MSSQPVSPARCPREPWFADLRGCSRRRGPPLLPRGAARRGKRGPDAGPLVRRRSRRGLPGLLLDLPASAPPKLAPLGAAATRPSGVEAGDAQLQPADIAHAGEEQALPIGEQMLVTVALKKGAILGEMKPGDRRRHGRQRISVLEPPLDLRVVVGPAGTDLAAHCVDVLAAGLAIYSDRRSRRQIRSRFYVLHRCSRRLPARCFPEPLAGR